MVRPMSETATLDEVRTFATELSPWAHLATIGADGFPDVAPVHPAWEAGTVWLMTGTDSVKARNIAAHPDIAMHWQVTEQGDGVELWGTATVHTDVETKRRLWDGVFDYNLGDFAPGGPDGSPEWSFVSIDPGRALIVLTYGMRGLRRWSAD
jgi:general stress protein 26